MDPLGQMINGLFFGLGAFIATTVGGYLIFKHSKKFIMGIISQIVEIWNKAKEEGLNLDGISVDAKVKTKKIFKKGKKEWLGMNVLNVIKLMSYYSGRKDLYAVHIAKAKRRKNL